MLPQIKLALLVAKLVKEHGPKILHSNNPDLLTRDLGDALKKQKDILSDPRKSMIMTGYDVVPLVVEVKILTVFVAKKLDIDTKGKPDIVILEEIIAKSEERNGGKFSKDIKDTLEWTRRLFAHPEIQEILKMEVTEIEKPKGVRDLTKIFKQVVSRAQDEATRVTEFLRRAKDLSPQPQPEPKPEPKAEEKKPEPPKPQGPQL